MRYVIVIEKAESDLSVYVPDLPGCITTGATTDEVVAGIREAIALHRDGLREEGEAIPEPSSVVECVGIVG